jgi:pimeloyl-ACP methyl ester carboxylesterase
VACYRSLLARAARVEVLPVTDSRHFVMFDQPQALNNILRTYLQVL